MTPTGLFRVASTARWINVPKVPGDGSGIAEKPITIREEKRVEEPIIEEAIHVAADIESLTNGAVQLLITENGELGSGRDSQETVLAKPNSMDSATGAGDVESTQLAFVPGACVPLANDAGDEMVMAQ